MVDVPDLLGMSLRESPAFPLSGANVTRLAVAALVGSGVDVSGAGPEVQRVLTQAREQLVADAVARILSLWQRMDTFVGPEHVCTVQLVVPPHAAVAPVGPPSLAAFTEPAGLLQRGNWVAARGKLTEIVARDAFLTDALVAALRSAAMVGPSVPVQVVTAALPSAIARAVADLPAHGSLLCVTRDPHAALQLAATAPEDLDGRDMFVRRLWACLTPHTLSCAGRVTHILPAPVSLRPPPPHPLSTPQWVHALPAKRSGFMRAMRLSDLPSAQRKQVCVCVCVCVCARAGRFGCMQLRPHSDSDTLLSRDLLQARYLSLALTLVKRATVPAVCRAIDSAGSAAAPGRGREWEGRRTEMW